MELSSSREDLGQRTFAQKIAPDLVKWLAGIENVAIRVDARKHRGETLEITEAQECLDRARWAIDWLHVLPAPLDDFAHELQITRIFDQAKVGKLFLERSLRREDEALFACPVQNALDFADIPLFDYRADGDVSRMRHARPGQRDILHHLRQGRGL